MFLLMEKLASYLADGSSCIDSFFSELRLWHASAHTPASYRFLPGWWQQLYWQLFLWAPPVTYECPHSCFPQIPTWLMAAAVLTAFSLSSACDMWVPTPPISCFRLSRDVSWKVKYFTYFPIAPKIFFRRPFVHSGTAGLRNADQQWFNGDPDLIL